MSARGSRGLFLQRGRSGPVTDDGDRASVDAMARAGAQWPSAGQSTPLYGTSRPTKVIPSRSRPPPARGRSAQGSRERGCAPCGWRAKTQAAAPRGSPTPGEGCAHVKDLHQPGVSSDRSESRSGARSTSYPWKVTTRVESLPPQDGHGPRRRRCRSGRGRAAASTSGEPGVDPAVSGPVSDRVRGAVPSLLSAKGATSGMTPSADPVRPRPIRGAANASGVGRWSRMKVSDGGSHHERHTATTLRGGVSVMGSSHPLAYASTHSSVRPPLRN